ncbi:hypothetical protein ACI2K6_16480 [Microbacterium sp. NPDC006705]|uniref:hypothetical protein n=1 Tax=Microbacterium TaxID=33882 RepID=UPI00384DC783
MTKVARLAVAAEAAAQQGQFEDMYHRLFETQEQWGEAQESHAALFRDFAADPTTEERVRFEAALQD